MVLLNTDRQTDRHIHTNVKKLMEKEKYKLQNPVGIKKKVKDTLNEKRQVLFFEINEQFLFPYNSP